MKWTSPFSMAVLLFGSFALDLERLCRRGPSGEQELRRKSFKLMRHLIEHAGREVTKEEPIKLRLAGRQSSSR